MFDSNTMTIMLVGESDVGKTHYGAQLLRRLNARTIPLRMRAAPTNLTPFEEALKRIDDGLAAEHTAREYAADSLWPVAADGNELDLVWPEYGGEQLDGILTSRRVPAAWRDRARASDGWLVLVRANNKENGDDFLTRPLSDLRTAPKGELPYRHTNQARVVELLQMLLFMRGSDVANERGMPKISVALSCWDELPEDQIELLPDEVVRRRLPLLAAFVESNWPADMRSTIGLSALERALSDKTPDVEFIERGPLKFGYVVSEAGERSADLGLPLTHLAGWR